MIEKYVDSKELKRLLSTLVVVLGCLIIAALFGVLVIPGLRNANKPATQTGVSPVTGETGWLDPTEFPPEKGRVIPPVDPATLMHSTSELIAQGKALFETHCIVCHGKDGKGDGPASGTMNPKPRNFTSQQGWVNGRNIPAIYKTLGHGIPGSSMAAFDYLSKRDRMELVHFVLSLGGSADTAGSPEAMQALSKELASPGEKTHNKIPVSMAIAKLQEEYHSPSPLVISPDDRSAGAELLRGTVWEPSRVARALHASVLWRSGPDVLARSVLADIPDNGFSATVAALKPNQWKTLYDELMKRIRVQ